jgi:hypothetical protein
MHDRGGEGEEQYRTLVGIPKSSQSKLRQSKARLSLPLSHACLHRLGRLYIGGAGFKLPAASNRGGMGPDRAGWGTGKSQSMHDSRVTSSCLGEPSLTVTLT